MNNNSQLSLWVDDSLIERFDSSLYELMVQDKRITKRGVIAFLLQKWVQDKQIREEFMKEFKQKNGDRHGRH